MATATLAGAHAGQARPRYGPFGLGCALAAIAPERLTVRHRWP